MASGMSKFLETELLKHSVGKAFTTPAKVFIALCQGEVKPAENGTEIESAVAGKGNECVSGTKKYEGYARIEIPVAEWVLTSENPVKMKNKAKITFPACTAGSAKVKYIALCTALTAGEVLYYGEVTEFEVSTTATPPEAIAEALEITLK
jgi:hypothetical protein